MELKRTAPTRTCTVSGITTLESWMYFDQKAGPRNSRRNGDSSSDTGQCTHADWCQIAQIVRYFEANPVGSQFLLVQGVDGIWCPKEFHGLMSQALHQLDISSGNHVLPNGIWDARTLKIHNDAIAAIDWPMSVQNKSQGTNADGWGTKGMASNVKLHRFVASLYLLPCQGSLCCCSHEWHVVSTAAQTVGGC